MCNNVQVSEIKPGQGFLFEVYSYAQFIGLFTGLTLEFIT